MSKPIVPKVPNFQRPASTNVAQPTEGDITELLQPGDAIDTVLELEARLLENKGPADTVSEVIEGQEAEKPDTNGSRPD